MRTAATTTTAAYCALCRTPRTQQHDYNSANDEHLEGENSQPACLVTLLDCFVQSQECYRLIVIAKRLNRMLPAVGRFVKFK